MRHKQIEAKKQLTTAYTNFLEDIKSVNIPQDYLKDCSAPLFIYPFEEYLNANCKILMVGQETCGWEESLSQAITASQPERIRDLMKYYADFDFAAKSRRRNTPFWRFYQTLKAQTISDRDKILWTNIFKFDYKRKPVKQEYGDVFIPLLRTLFLEEVRILKPDFIVFTTGYNYDKYLREFLGPGLPEYSY